MLFWNLLRDVLILIGSALILGVISKKMKQSAIIGYILAGMIVGPFLSDTFAIKEVAELGICLMLFSIGLEFSLSRLRQMGKFAILGGLLQITLTLIAFFLLLLPFLSISHSLIIGIAVSLSSTAITLRLLTNNNELDTIHGRACVGILLAQDLAVIPLVMLVGFMSGTGGSSSEVFMEIAKTIGSILGLVFCFYILFYKVMPKILMTEVIGINRDFIALVALISGLGSAWTSHYFGLSPSLGAFIAGMLLGESPFSSQIRSDIGSLRIIFVTTFFASIGMLVKPAWILDYGVISAVFILSVIVVKTLIIYTTMRVFKFNKLSSIISGLFLAQIGEFSFIIINVALSKELINEELFSVIATSNILSLIVTPYIIKFTLKIKQKLSTFFQYNMLINELDSGDFIDPYPDIIVVGYGPVGKKINRLIRDKGIKSRVIEFNPRFYNQALIDGADAILGDASRIDILKHAKIHKAKVVVISLADISMTKRVLLALRMIDQKVKVHVRGHYSFNSKLLYKAGANVVVDEESLTGKKLAFVALSELDSIKTISFTEAISGQSLPPLPEESGLDTRF